MSITKKKFKVNVIPAILWGEPSENLYLYIHGQGGNKEEAYNIAKVICRYGYQVLSVDLPEHGERREKTNSFDPWHIVPELKSVMEFAKNHWRQISLFANSIGVWFSMLSFCNEELNQCLFVSPVLDMKMLILKMMSWANVSKAQLKQERFIKTSFGQTLSWDYWEYVQNHTIEQWNIHTDILYGENDTIVDYDTVKQFADKFNCGITIMINGEHWFHTDEQSDFMCDWLRQKIKYRN